MKTRDISPPKVPRNEAAHWCSLVAQKAPTVMFSSPVLAGGHLPHALALDTPSTCLTSGLESLKLEKPFQGPNLGTPRQRFLSGMPERGLVSIGASTRPRDGGPIQAPRFTGGVADTRSIVP